jgi:hypothetical protein
MKTLGSAQYIFEVYLEEAYDDGAPHEAQAVHLVRLQHLE